MIEKNRCKQVQNGRTCSHHFTYVLKYILKIEEVALVVYSGDPLSRLPNPANNQTLQTRIPNGVVRTKLNTPSEIVHAPRLVMLRDASRC